VLDSKVADKGTLAPRDNEHFNTSLTDYRELLRRFVRVLEVSIPAGGKEHHISLLDLMHNNVYFRELAPMYRYMRGSVLVRVFLETEGTLRVSVSATTNDALLMNGDALGLATKLLSTVVPTATFEVPFLSTLNCNYTPYGIPIAGSSYSQDLSFRSFDTTSMKVSVWCRMGDGFRFGGFVGLPAVVVYQYPTPEPPTEVTLQSDEELAGGVFTHENRPVITSVTQPTTTARYLGTHLPEENWTIPDLVERYTFVNNYSWDTSDDVGTVLFKLQIPLELLNNSIGKIPTDTFRFFRYSHITIRVQLNGTPMHQGRLAVFYQPGVPDSDYNTKYLNTTTFITSLDSNALLDPAKSTVAEIVVPFNHPLGALHMGEANEEPLENFTHFLGYVRGIVFNKLRIGAAGSQSVDFNVITRIHGLRALVPQSKFTI
jgi:hypothetical protein